MKITKVTIFFALVICGAAVFADASATSGYFTVDTAKFAIDDVTSPYCSGAYNSGRKATFISGVRCQIDFEVKIDTPETRQLSHFLVNGSRVDSTVGFRLNVGGLNPGERLEVVAVDKDGGKTDPFRVNIDMASGQPWTNGGNHFLAAQNEKRGVVIYYLESFSAFFWMDGIAQMYEIAGKEFPLNVTPSFKVASTFDSESAQYTVGVGIGATWSGMEDKVASVKKLFDKIKKQPMCKFAGAQITGSFTGGSVCQWNPQTLSWVDAGGTLNISAEGKVDLISFRVPQTLYLVYVRAGLDAQGSISASKINGEWSGELGFNPLLGGHGTVGAGLQDALCVEGSASCGLFLTGQFPANPGYLKELGFDVKASWKTVFLGLERPHGMWEHTFMWYPRGERFVDISANDVRRLVAASPSESTSGELRLVRRDYLGSHMPRRLHAIAADASLGDGYPYPAPSLAVGDRDVLVYLRDNDGRSAINRTELVCRIGERGEYGAATAIWDDGTADFMPQVSQNASGLSVAAWANAKTAYGDSDFGALYSGMEIAVAVRDPSTGEWTAQNLTDDAVLDMTPRVAVAEDGSAAVAWVKNQSNDVVGSPDLPSSLYVAYYRDGIWSAPQQVATVGLLYSFDLSYDGSFATIVYAKDKDGDAATEEDAEVWYASLPQGSAAVINRLSADGENALRPFVWQFDSTLRTVFLQGGVLMCSDDLATASAMPTNETVPSDYSVLKNADGSALVAWREKKEGSAGDETRTLLLNKSGTLGDVSTVLVGGGDTFARNMTGGVAHDGSLHIAYECVSVSFNSEGMVDYGDVELKSVYRDAAVDVGITDGALAFDGDVEAGATVNVVVPVSNFGTTAARGVKVELWRGAEGATDRRLIGTAVADIEALSSVSLSFPWTVEQGLGELVFVASVDPSQELNDVDRSNNSLEWRPDLQRGELSLRNAVCTNTSDTTRRISAKVYNGGILPYSSGAKVRFWRGEAGATLLGTRTLGEILSGESGACEVFCDWNLSSLPMTSVVERVVIEINAGEESSSISVDVEGRVWRVVLEPQGGQVSESTLKIMKGSPLGVLPTPTKSGSRFVGWYTMPDAGEELTAGTVINSDYMLYAHWETFVCRVVQPSATRPENDTATIAVAGGNDNAASSVKLYLAYQTAAAADLDLANGAVDGVKPNGGLKFPLTLSWEKGEVGERVVTIPIIKDTTIENDECFTLQLAEAVGMELGETRACTVTIHDPGYDELAAKIADGSASPAETAAWEKLQKAKAPYVSGLPDPADGGKVSGSGPCAAGKKVTLKATANKNSTFLGWRQGVGNGYVATTATLVIDRSARPAASNKTSATITNLTGDVTYYAVFKSDPKVTVSVEDTDEKGASLTGKGAGKYVAGTITGEGKCAPGKKVTLKAAANKGYVFSQWERTGDGFVSRAASITFAMPSNDVGYVAKFVTTEADLGYAVGLSLGDECAVGGSFADETLRCGIAVNWPVEVDALSETTVKANGLPAGLKLVQDKDTKAYRVEGVPTAASKVDKKGTVTPSGVKFTVTTAGKNMRTFSKNVVVKPLPTWAYGTFGGVLSPASPVSEGRPPLYGAVSMTVSAVGKISGKIDLGGTNYAFSANGYTDRSEVADDDSEAALFVDAVATGGKAVLPLLLDGLRDDVWLSAERAAVTNTLFSGMDGSGLYGVELRRELWKDPGNAAALSEWAGAYTYVTANGDSLALTVDEKGGVKVAGTLGGKRKVSLSPMLHPYFVDAYVAPTKTDAAFFERIALENCHGDAVPGGGVAYRDAGVFASSSSFDGSGSGTITINPKYGQAAAGKPVTLTAKPAKDSVFVKWVYRNGDGEEISDYSPTLKLVAQGYDVPATALFAAKENVAKPEPYVAAPEGGIDVWTHAVVGAAFKGAVLVDDTARPVSFTAKNLPAGLKIDKATGVISGRPTKPFDGTVSVTATSGVDSKVSGTVEIPMKVHAIPERLKGAFNGFVTDFSEETGNPGWIGLVRGLFTATVADNGSIAVKMTTGFGTVSFKADGWDDVEWNEDRISVARATMTGGKGEKLSLLFLGGINWDERELDGRVSGGIFGETELSVLGDRNEFVKVGGKYTHENMSWFADELVGTWDLYVNDWAETWPEVCEPDDNGLIYPYSHNLSTTGKEGAQPSVRIVVKDDGTATVSGKFLGENISGTIPIIVGWCNDENDAYGVHFWQKMKDGRECYISFDLRSSRESGHVSVSAEAWLRDFR